jgi:hypothetical protein
VIAEREIDFLCLLNDKTSSGPPILLAQSTTDVSLWLMWPDGEADSSQKIEISVTTVINLL